MARSLNQQNTSMTREGRHLVMPGLAILLVITVVAAACTGSVSIPAVHVLQYMASHTGLTDPGIPWQHEAVLGNIRLPRIFLGTLVGATLAVSGASLQAIFRNPLADPGLVGISSGCALAAAGAIVFGTTLTGEPWILPIAAFVGGIAAVSVVHLLAAINGRVNPATMLLAGIAVNALCATGIGLLVYLGDDLQMRQFLFWTMGSLSNSDWSQIVPASLIMFLTVFLLVRQSNQLNILVLGEREAGHLGMDVPRFIRWSTVLVSLGVGAAVSVSGTIGFVGLVVPHLVRLAIGADHRLLLPGAALAGAILMTLSDTAARTLAEPAEMPIGLLCSLIGAPCLVWLLFGHTRRSTTS